MPATSSPAVPPSPTAVALDGIYASYSSESVLRGITLQAEPGELVAILGPSGCGKTTLLKIVAGLLTPDAGELRFGSEVVTRHPPERRRAPMVFQQPLLFPHLNVTQNIAFSLDLRGSPAAERDAHVRDVVRLLKLEGLEARLPRELSGGQEQRVSLARAIVSSPQVLLLDEPFSALDESLRAELRYLTLDVQKRLGITTLFVTHDQQEASTVASRIVLLMEGCVAQQGHPRDFYTRPASIAVARFFGWQCLRTAEHRWLAFRSNTARLLPPNSSKAQEGWRQIYATRRHSVDVGSHYLTRLVTSSGDEVDIQTDDPPAATDASVLLTLDPASTLEFGEEPSHGNDGAR